MFPPFIIQFQIWLKDVFVVSVNQYLLQLMTICKTNLKFVQYSMFHLCRTLLTAAWLCAVSVNILCCCNCNRLFSKTTVSFKRIHLQSQSSFLLLFFPPTMNTLSGYNLQYPASRCLSCLLPSFLCRYVLMDPSPSNILLNGFWCTFLTCFTLSFSWTNKS